MIRLWFCPKGVPLERVVGSPKGTPLEEPSEGVLRTIGYPV
jgi:hypothetical protein